MEIVVAARASPLSKKQVFEVHREIIAYYPDIIFMPYYSETTGDKDLKTSLKGLEKTDFFTKEIDTLLLSGKCRIAIHSAKDLPEPIPVGLTIVAITKGVDASDALVFREGENLHSLPVGAKIGASSDRRENNLKKIRQDFTFVDIRGTIEQRLSKLYRGDLDGVVIAEAALIRLGLTGLSRVILEGDTPPLQGKLAVLCRQEDLEMATLFACLDTREEKSDPKVSDFEHEAVCGVEAK